MRRELAVTVAAAATFGLLLASYSAFRPVRDALILDGDPDQIPWLFTASFVAVLAVSPIWGALVKHRPRRVVPIAFHVFALCAFAFAAVIRSGIDPTTVGRVFYVWAAVFNLFVVSVFWSLLADLLGPASAKRLYGPIAAGGTIGTVVGPALAKALVSTIGVAGIVALTGVLLELAIIGVMIVRRVGTPDDSTEDEPIEGGAFDGMRHVLATPYLRTIVGYVLCTSCAATFIYLAQAHIVHDALSDRIARTKYFANVDLVVAGVTFVLQVAVARPLISRLGPGLVLCILPLIQVTGLVILVGSPSLDALMIVLAIGRGATHGLTRPARELLFTVISRADKYRAKNAIDTVGYRLGDFGASWLGKGLAAAANTALVGGVAVLGGIWIVLAVLLGRGFKART
ncbi:MAG: MFS transporter [Kofleriaceae bacterium]